MRYRVMRVDRGISRIADRYDISLHDLWQHNDPGPRFTSAQAWANSLHVNSEIDIPMPRDEERWEWDEWTTAPGSDNMKLSQFVALINAERRRLHARGRPTGPVVDELYLWNALHNAGFRDAVLHDVAAQPGSTYEQVDGVDDQPDRSVNVRENGRFRTIYVPAAPWNRTSSHGARPNVDGEEMVNELHIQPHWLRTLHEKLYEIRRTTDVLRGNLVRRAEACEDSLETLASFGRLDELLRVIVEGRNERVYASEDAATLAEVATLRRQLHTVHQRASRVAAAKRDRQVPPRRLQELSASLRDNMRDPQLHALLVKATKHGYVVNGDNAQTNAKVVLEDALKTGLEYGAEWAHDDLAKLLNPTTTAAQTLPLYTALITPFVGNTPGPASAWVAIVQYAAVKRLHDILETSGGLANARVAVDELITRSLVYTRNSRAMTLARYQEWARTVNEEEARIHGLFASSLRNPAEWAAELDRWDALRNAVVGPSGETVAGLRERILGIMFSSDDIETKKRALRELSNSELTQRVNTSTRMASFMLVLNLGLIALQWAAYATAGTAEERDSAFKNAVIATVGGTIPAVSSFMQILANRNRLGWFAGALEGRIGTAFGHISAGLSILLAIVGAVSTYQDWGTSHMAALSSAIAGSLGSAALAWPVFFEVATGTAAALTGIGLVLTVAAALLALIGDNDPLVKLVFMDQCQRLHDSGNLRALNAYLIDHPDGGGHDLLTLIHQVKGAAQRTRFARPVWNERSALRHVGFSDDDIDGRPNRPETALVDARPRVNVGAFVPTPATP